MPVVGTLNTLSGLMGGPTIGGMMQAGTPVGPENKSNDLGGDGAMPPRGPLSSATNVAAVAPYVNPISATYLDAKGNLLPSVVDLTTALNKAALERKYLGAAANPSTYGYGPAYKYYADGGIVSPPRPPVQPTVASQPTMAYTDGQGLVGAVASPPGLLPSDSVGSDAPHTSPMAFAPAAAAPTLTPDEPMLATRNVNASPVAAPISQNPNLGYSLGMSPLARLAGMRNV